MIDDVPSTLAVSGRHPIMNWIIVAVGALLFAPVLLQLYDFSQNQGSSHYSHFVLIPVIAGYFAFLRRREIWRASCDRTAQASGVQDVTARALGIFLLAVSIALYVVASLRVFNLPLNDHLALTTTSWVLYMIGAFISVFGMNAFQVAKFPLLFLVFLIPVPDSLLQRIVVGLQVASTAVVDLLLQLTGTVYHRDGFRFSLPGLHIEVAEQCSGIRSSLSLFIVSIVAGHTSLRTRWGKILLALTVFPITVFKNGVRIVLLSLLAIHWDNSIMQGGLHRVGGVPFFAVAMCLLGLVLLALREFERRS